MSAEDGAQAARSPSGHASGRFDLRRCGPTDHDEWHLVEPHFDAQTSKAYEGLFTLGAPGLHIRGSLEEGLPSDPQDERYLRLPANVTSEVFRHPRSRWGTFVPGVYAPHPLLNAELVNLPNLLLITPEVNGEPLHVERPDLVCHHRGLDLRHGVLERITRWRQPSGRVVELQTQRFIVASDDHRQRLVIQRAILRLRHSESDRNAVVSTTGEVEELGFRVGIDANVTTNGFDHFRDVTMRRAVVPSEAGAGCELDVAVVTDAGDHIRMRSVVTGHTPPGESTVVIGEWGVDASEAGASRHDRRVTCLVGPVAGAELMVEKRTAVAVGLGQPATGPSDADLQWATPLEQLRTTHDAVWSGRWSAADVVVDGDPAAQRAIRVSVHHLLRAHPGVGQKLAIDAKGYAGEAYWGRFFWDTEMFLLPFYAAVAPRLAESLVQFRVDTLEGARANARRDGYRGARYPWESDPEGRECCPNWQYGDHEVHVTADVAYGLAMYALASGTGHAFLTRPAVAQTVIETARFWLDRIDISSSDDVNGLEQPNGSRRSSPPTAAVHDRREIPSHSPLDRRAIRADLLGVMGPDEYTPLSHNNAFTNRLVRFNLQLAARLIEATGGDQAEAAWMDRVGEALPVLRHPQDPRLVLQCDGFERLADPAFDRLWLDRDRTFASQVSQERLYRSRALKQADVLMLMWLFQDEFTLDEVAAAWDYYEPLTTHDSSLSAGVHALLALRLGHEVEAMRYWSRCASIDLDVRHGGAAEGIHIANAALAWMGVMYGFAGICPLPVGQVARRSYWRSAATSHSAGQPTTGHRGMRIPDSGEDKLACDAEAINRLIIRPVLPRRWDRLRFPHVFRGRPLDIELRRSRVHVRNRSETRPVMVQVGNTDPLELAPGASCDLGFGRS